MQVQIKKLDGTNDLPDPKYMSAHAAGIDLHAAVEVDTVLEPGNRTLIPTGIAIALPPQTEAQVRPRSGLALKHGVTLLNAPGTIDADYRGEVGVILINHGQNNFVVKRGDRIAQLVITTFVTARFEFVTELPTSERSTGGFGSTGVQ